ncbi:hypothetical protein B0P06_006097 [Clostridium saccharoperbutylacetonicum]|uniref:Uncharacterized protein n=1 Tax=Clostridium saccharoperbutylacetonicum N1-4(HMT) TaxID=931276 RepID=M1MU54_9CLOT|nr:hypothetical protein [Clostridium saccharoperbutylacetonicum]AGF59628.1 hypothetical protein Cspa_135p00680 [Clostridium saccharoperbutylacetonicum N1-4(HMT)]NRT64515.1 hypothetical protein [Clostridium saccharoperbutylacetonicum]NSB28990.1 hypothetical protein [Clostridium saccharoperbutylacetonicum]NSB46204.1 hypothetical protein [Clostridium saccharoperbutylacetonicum]
MLDIINNAISNINFGEIITTVVIAALGTLIAKVRPYVKDLLDNLFQYVLLQIESSQYEDQFKKACDIWKLVDENFRIGADITKEFENKADYFDNLLLQKFPSLTQGEIDYIRQVIAGNENSVKTTTANSQTQADKLQEDDKSAAAAEIDGTKIQTESESVQA